MNQVWNVFGELFKGGFIQYSFFVRFFFTFFLLRRKYAIFHPQFYMSISAQTKQSHTGQKFSQKIFL